MNRKIKAIILGAGEGKRLRPYTQDRPKCLVELGGVPLLVHQTDVLKQAGVRDITVVAGYCADQIKALGYTLVMNKDYDTTNMVFSLMCARAVFDGMSDVLIAYGDIVYELEIVQKLLACQAPVSTTIDQSWRNLWRIRKEDPTTKAETLKLDRDLHILELGKKPKDLTEVEGQYMGLIKLRADMGKKMVAFYDSLDPELLYDGQPLRNMYMTSFLQAMIDAGYSIEAVLVNGGWVEVDTTEDLETYQRMIKASTLGQLCRIPTRQETKAD